MSKKSADESSKKAIAKRVVADKRRYFFPESGRVVDAIDMNKAIKAQSVTKVDELKQETGDGE